MNEQMALGSSNYVTWVVGRGLIGSPIHSAAEQAFSLSKINWQAASLSDQFQSDAQRFREFAGDRPWAVGWSAGRGVVGTSATELAKESQALMAFLTAIAKHKPSGCGVVVGISSAGAIYAKSTNPPFNEATEPAPASDYGEAKLEQEQIIASNAKNLGVSSLILRTANVYGRLGNRNHWLLYAIVGVAALMGVLLFSSNFYPLEALAETGGIVAIPVFSIVFLLVGTVAFLIFAYRSNKKPKERINNLIWFSSVGLGVATLIAAGVALYSIAQVGSVSYYAIKFEYLLLVLLLPFSVAGATWVLSKFQFTNWIFVPASLITLLIPGNLFGYSLPVGQRAFLETGLPPNYISPGLGWLQLADDPNSYPGFPGNLIAQAGQLPAEGVVVVWNPPDLAETQERGAQVYANSMRYTGNTWVWSLADTLLGTEWGDEALDQLWNWRWDTDHWDTSANVVVVDKASRRDLEGRLSEFWRCEPVSPAYPCLAPFNLVKIWQVT